MRVFIAGATGVLGRRLITQLVEKGHKAVGLARSEKAAELIRSLGGEAVTASLFDADAMARAVGQADVVIHAATAIPVKEKTKPEDWKMNDRIRREGTRALTEAAAKIGAKIYLQQSIVWLARPADDSFFDEKTKPQNIGEVYLSAYDGEQIALEAGERNGFQTGILRCGAFYSADAAHTKMFGLGLLKRRLPILGRGKAVTANIHADDAASAFVTAAESGKSGVWHIIDDAPKTTVGDVLGELARLLKAPAPFRIPSWLGKLIIGKTAEFFLRSTRTSNALFKSETNWSPRFPTFREGLQEVVGTWRAEGFVN